IAGHWKYIAAQRWLPPAERPEAARIEAERRQKGWQGVDVWGPVVHEELYNLDDDPRELRKAGSDASASRIDIAHVLATFVQSRAVAGAQRVMRTLSTAEIERLRALGYVQ